MINDFLVMESDSITQGMDEIAGYIHSKVYDQKERMIKIEEYLSKEVFPDDRSSENNLHISTKVKNTRIGNFGEIIATLFLINFREYSCPIYKLQFRDNKNWSVRLTDLCLFKLDKIPAVVCYGEVKTKTSKFKGALGVEAYESLAINEIQRNPEILIFIKRKLHDLKKMEEAEVITKIQYKKIKSISEYKLFLIHENKTWKEIALKKLNEYLQDKTCDDLQMNIVLINDLRSIIEKTYNAAPLAAESIINER